jgi:hypothetical protein
MLNRLYEMATAKKVEWYKNLASDHALVVRQRLQVMNAKEHLDLIADILQSHAGGKRFCLEYNLPFDKIYSSHANTLKELTDYLTNYETKLVVSLQNGIMISNCDMNAITDYDRGMGYQEYSYRRFDTTSTGDKVTYSLDFDCQNEEHDFDLILFSPFIRVSVFDLQIPVHLICVRGESATSTRLPPNQTLHVPEKFDYLRK